MADATGSITTLSISESDENTIQCNITWTIDKFISRCNKPGDWLTSPIFSMEDNDKLKWTLLIYPYGFNEKTTDTVFLFLKLVASDKSEVIAMYESHILNAEGKKVISCNFNTSYNYTCEGQLWGSNFIDRDSLLTREKGLLRDNKLTILCEIRVWKDDTSGRAKASQCQLIYDMRQLFESKKWSDITINVSGRELPAHKAILATRNRVFAESFEENVDSIDINGFDYEVVSEMLRYIYTGTVMNMEKIAGRLIAVADTYKIRRLQDECMEVLAKNLATENAAEILVLADRHNYVDLKVKAINFIQKHTIEVMETQSFKSNILSNPELMEEILRALALKKMAT